MHYSSVIGRRCCRQSFVAFPRRWRYLAVVLGEANTKHLESLDSGLDLRRRTLFKGHVAQQKNPQCHAYFFSPRCAAAHGTRIPYCGARLCQMVVWGRYTPICISNPFVHRHFFHATNGMVNMLFADMNNLETGDRRSTTECGGGHTCRVSVILNRTSCTPIQACA